MNARPGDAAARAKALARVWLLTGAMYGAAQTAYARCSNEKDRAAIWDRLFSGMGASHFEVYSEYDHVFVGSRYPSPSDWTAPGGGQSPHCRGYSRFSLECLADAFSAERTSLRWPVGRPRWQRRRGRCSWTAPTDPVVRQQSG